jgi:uncharacterized phage protein (TIGR02218 family)
MVKTISGPMETHLALPGTTLATAWLITRKDGQKFRFTTASEDIQIDVGDGDGVQTYSFEEGYSRSNFQNDAELNIGNMEVVGVFDNAQLKETELRRGLFDGAEVRIFIFNYNDPSMGIIKQLRGKFAEALVTKQGFFHLELRDLTDAYSKQLGEAYSKDCRADLGDQRCMLPLTPPEVLRSTAYSLGQFVRASNPKYITQSITNGDAESGVTGWTNTLGTLATRGSAPSPDATNGGSAYFTGGTDAEVNAHQDITVPGAQEAAIDAGDRAVRLRWLQNSLDEATDDQAEMQIDFLDGTDAQIGATVSAGLTEPIVWTERALDVDVPALTRKLRIRMRMVRQTGTNNDGLIDFIRLDLVKKTLLTIDWQDRIYKVTTAGTSGVAQPTFDTTVGNTTTDGTVVFTAEEGWVRAVTVLSVDGANPRRIFNVTELTPNTAGPRGGFPDDWMNGGGCTFETGSNANRSLEVRDFTADDGITIEQTIELFTDLPFDIQVGDTLAIFPGCDKVYQTCIDKFNNAVNFVAEPFVPGEDILGQYPDAR